MHNRKLGMLDGISATSDQFCVRLMKFFSKPVNFNRTKKLTAFPYEGEF